MHRKRRSIILRLGIALLATAASVVAALLFAGSSSAAAAGDSVDATNSHIDAQCALNAKTVTSQGQTTYYLSSQAFPSSATGYLLNMRSEVDCTVLDANNADAVVYTLTRSAPSPLVNQIRTAITLPASDHYIVCAQGKVKVAEPPLGGKESWTPVVCTS